MMVRGVWPLGTSTQAGSGSDSPQTVSHHHPWVPSQVTPGRRGYVRSARCLPPTSASPGDAPLGLNALHPGVIYVLELQVVIHVGSVDAHGNGDGAQSVG